MTVLRGRLVSAAGVIDDGVVAVADGLIAYAGPAEGWSGPEPERAGTIVPGYVDLHCHGGGGHSFTDADPVALAAAAAHHLSRGTTTMLASQVSASEAELGDALERVACLAATGGPVVGSHLEGPWLAHARCGAHDPAALATPSSDSAARWVEQAGKTLRMVTLAPELDGAREASAVLSAAGAIVALGHTDATVEEFGEALRDAPYVTHLFNGMAPMHHRRPGPVAAALGALARGAAYVELIADGVHLDPGAVRLVFTVDPGHHVVLVSDAMPAAGLPDGDYTLGSLPVRVSGGQARTVGADSSLAGSTAHLADVVRHCVQVAGVDPVDVVTAATATPAGLLGLADRGRLAPGLRADLCVLDDDWRVTRVLRGGVDA